MHKLIYILEVSTKSLPLAIWGTGGHAVSVLETAMASGKTDIVFVDQAARASDYLGFPTITPEDLRVKNSNARITIAIGDNLTRQSVADRIKKLDPDARFETLVHPSAVVSSNATLGHGTVVLQGAIIGANADVRDHCIINSRVTLDHESLVEDFVSLAPGVLTGGRISIGPRSAIGIGAVIRHGICIGPDTVIGAASYVHNDLPGNVVAYGTPARIVRQRNVGDPYLT